MASIFFSYRKQGEDKPSSLRLADDFRAALGEEEIFRDEKGLKIGRFEDQLLSHIQSCKLIVAVIGPTWISRIADLHNEKDWVRRELEIGFERGVVIAPLLVDGALQPSQTELPASLAPLFDYQFLTIHARHWKADVDDLINSIADYLDLQRQDAGHAQQQAIPNLSGNWIDTEGDSIRLLHRGDDLQLMAYDPYGQVVGQGEGSVTENQIQFNLQRVDLGYGTGTGTVAADGNQISGQVQYGMQRFGFSIMRRS